MRRLLLGSAALTVMTAAAFAADLPARGPAVAPAPVYVAPIFTWTGFYVGLNAGVGFGGGNDSRLRASTTSTDQTIIGDVADINAGLAAAHRSSNDDVGFTGGAQIGYNWQFGAMVVGLEADINYLDRNRGHRNATIVDVFPGEADRYDLDLRYGNGGSNWFGTIRPRIGVAFDRTLVYATGGLAYGGSQRNGGSATLVNVTDDLEVARWEGRRSGSNWGWTIGAGVEHAFSNNWSMKLEYLYVDLDRGSSGGLVAVSGGNYGNAIAFRGGRAEDNFHVVRAGLNWRFGGPSYASGGPVVARY